MLRRPRGTDFDSYAKNIIDPVIAKNFMSNPKNRKEARKEFNDILKEKHTFFIIIKNNAIGSVSLHDIIPKHKAKISFWLGRDYRNEGIMTKAIRQLLKYADKMKLKRVYAYVRTFNKPSAKVLENCGFKLEGILKKNKFKNGKYLDDFLYARVR